MMGSRGSNDATAKRQRNIEQIEKPEIDPINQSSEVCFVWFYGTAHTWLVGNRWPDNYKALLPSHNRQATGMPSVITQCILLLSSY